MISPPSRRVLLANATMLSAGSVAAATLVKAHSMARISNISVNRRANPARYRETQLIRTFYRTAGYELGEGERAK
jgi:hypothetical protein